MITISQRTILVDERHSHVDTFQSRLFKSRKGGLWVGTKCVASVEYGDFGGWQRHLVRYVGDLRRALKYIPLVGSPFLCGGMKYGADKGLV